MYISRLSTTPIQSLIRHEIFSQTGLPREIDCLAPLWSISVKFLSQEHKDTLPC